MTAFQKIGFGIFVVFAAFAVVFSYLINAQYIQTSEKPWHMQPFIDADSLTADYVDNYDLLGKGQLSSLIADTSRVTVSILVDAWGVPFDTALLRKDFAVFKDLPHKEYLHYRVANRTRHAEFAELRLNDSNGVYLFGGDSLEYGRNLYIDSLGYTEHIFCYKCPDSTMFVFLNMILQEGTAKSVALTTQDSRDGNRIKLHSTLQLIAECAQKHPKAQFVVQGTHRPLLGDPKIRQQSFNRWVPGVIGQ